MADAHGEIEERLTAIRKQYTHELPERIRRAREAWAALRADIACRAHLEALYGAIHTLVGSGATFGYRGVSDAALSLDAILQPVVESGTPPTRDQIAPIAALLDRLERASTARDDTPPVGSSDAPAAFEDEEARRIFVVDSDAGRARTWSVELAQFGYAIESYSSVDAVDAVDGIVAGRRPSAIIVDMTLPDGRLANAETVARLRARFDSRVSVIFTATRGDFAARLNAVRAGADAFFTRPVEIGDFVERLDVLTGRSLPEPYRVLVVENDATMADYYASVLNQAGMVAEALTDPTKVLERIAAFFPDIVLTDLYLPGCSGLDLAKVIRQQNVYAAMPLVFLSAERREDKQLTAMSLGGDAFLTKPVRTEQLIASIVSRAERSRIVRSMMVRDSLTGLLNHSRLKEQLAIEVARAKRTGAPLAFAMLDIDHFKSVNDTYGHPTGDRVLKSLAQVLMRSLRKTDVIGRYGGEEFGVVLVNADGARAKTIIDEVRANFANLRNRDNGKQFSVTFSGGVAEFPLCGDDTTLNETADKALYEAKNGGRNRVVLADAITG